MLRRAWLKAVLGTVTAGMIARDWLVEVASGQEPVALLPPAPTSLAAAIGTNSGAPVASFILAHPTTAASAALTDRGKMLYLMSASVPDLSDIWNRNSFRVQAEYERAALVILKGIESRPADLATIVKSVGGKALIERRIPAIQSAELKKIAIAAIK